MPDFKEPAGSSPQEVESFRVWKIAIAGVRNVQSGQERRELKEIRIALLKQFVEFGDMVCEAVVVFDDDKEALYVNDQARALKLGLAEELGSPGGIAQFKEFLSNYNPMLLVDESLSLAFSEFEKRNAR